MLSGQHRLQQHLQTVQAFARANDMPGAMRAAYLAVEQGFEHKNLLTLAAYDQINTGDLEQALRLALRARDFSPRDPDALNVLGLTLARLNRFRDAIPVYDAALRGAPAQAHLHFNRACALEEIGDVKRARTAFELVVSLQPDHAEAFARLASMAAQRGDPLKAREYAQRSLRLDPAGTAAPLALALADIEERKFSSALILLQDFSSQANPSVINRAIALGLVGDAHDGLDEIDQAFEAFATSKRILRELYRPIYDAPGVETASQRIGRMISFFESSQAGHAQGKFYESPVRTHVFLVGFPRSGTTLLERALDSHPDIEAMQERDCLLDAANDFVMPLSGLEKLALLDETDCQKYRSLYWTRVAQFHAMSSKHVFVDKMPLNSVLLCLVAKLFPRAKILFALRDPRDIVFSCFRRRFGMTAQMYELLSLDSAARYYSSVLTLSELYHQKQSLDVHHIRYENLVRNFAEETQAICDFLDIAWSGDMNDFAKRLRAIDVNTPSAAQVARGLYSTGVGQWRRYREQLAPVLPILAPWVERFDYPQD